MRHEFTTNETAKILGRSYATILRYGEAGILKRTPIRGAGSKMRFIYTEEEIQSCADKIGIAPKWEASGRIFTAPEPETPTEGGEDVTILSEWIVIRFGNYYLSDNMSLTSMDKAKRFGTEGIDTAREQRDSTGGKIVLIQTIAKEIE